MTDGSVCGFVVVVYHRKIRPTQLWVELTWVVAMIYNPGKNLTIHIS